MDRLRIGLARMAGMEDRQRLYRLHSDLLGGCIVDRWTGRDALSDHAQTDVDVLSLSADIALEALPGTLATLTGRMADGSEWQRSGLIHEARRVSADGGLVRYRLSLMSWTWWLQHARNSRVFQEQSLRQIIDAVLGDHPQLACWRWAKGCDAFLEGRVRSYCVQYRESDLAFMQRLLAEEGLGWRLYRDENAPCGNGMEIFADSIDLPEDAVSASGGVRFHRSDATETRDSVQQIGRRSALGSTRLSLQSDDYLTVRGIGAHLPIEGGGSAGGREDHDAVGAYAFSSGHEAQRQARLQAEAREAHRSGWLGQGTVRGFQAGNWVALQQAPLSAPAGLLLVEVCHAGINNLPADMRAALDAEGETPALPQHEPALWESAEKVGYGNRFNAVDRAQAWRPILVDDTGARLNPRPTVPGYQTALVVAAAGGGSDVYADSLGRVRVRFHFQDGRSGANDSAWLRVAQRYAGPGVGSQFLPRVDQEVVVGFLDGDIDRPIVLGALYNGRGEAGTAPTPAGAQGTSDRAAYTQANDSRSSAQSNLTGGNAPAWHAAGGGDDAHRHGGALWGIRSREWEGGQGSNHLLFDDLDQQLRVQLSSSQHASQLTLGHLRYQSDNYLGSLRGTGFELRTDAWGAVRATSGNWFTAYMHPASAPAGEVVQPAALLKQLQAMGGKFSKAAQIHLTSPLAIQEGAGSKSRSKVVADKAPLAALLASVQTVVAGDAYASATGQAPQRKANSGAGRVPHSGDPVLGLAAPAGIVHAAGQALHWTVGEGLLLASGGNSDAAVMGQARLHAGQAIGMLAAAVQGGSKGNALSVVAGTGELDLQAQNDAARLQSRKPMRVVSAQGAVELGAGKTIHIATAGGASVTIEGGNITFNCPGTIKVHAGKKSFVGPMQGDYPLPLFPKSVCVECMLKAAVSGAPFAALQ